MSPTPPGGNWPTWSYGTAVEPAAKTASAPRKTPVWPTCQHGFDQNRIWLAIVQLACELTAWTQMLALTGHSARKWEPKRLRLRLFSIAGRLARHARRTRLRLAAHAPHTELITTGLTRLAALAAPP